MNADCRPTKPSPHIADYSKRVSKLMNYNGTGRWAVAEIQRRYDAHAEKLGLGASQLTPGQHTEGDKHWIYPGMWDVIRRMEQGDGAAIEIGIEMVEEDDFFCFGRLIKSACARALRRVPLDEMQRSRLRTRIVRMMLAGYVPHEFHEYRRLLRRVGVGELWPALDEGVDRENRYVMRHYDYLNKFARTTKAEGEL